MACISDLEVEADNLEAVWRADCLSGAGWDTGEGPAASTASTASAANDDTTVTGVGAQADTSATVVGSAAGEAAWGVAKIMQEARSSSSIEATGARNMCLKRRELRGEAATEEAGVSMLAAGRGWVGDDGVVTGLAGSADRVATGPR